ncbi:MAG: hypothetical protein JNL75_02900 [Chitinophagales bacterium]|nr:hypothetical protein [Chitinophagales bacterium]
MENIFKDYEKTIKKKHSIAFTPNYKEEFKTTVNNTLFVAIAEIVVEKLGWDLVYKDDNNIEAKRSEKSMGMERWTEAISASYNFGNILVKSESLGSEVWDLGRNSKRVKLFIYAFEKTLKSFDNESLKKLEKENEKKKNWDDYVIPDKLPNPVKPKTPNIIIPIIGGIIVSIILGYILAFVSLKGIYVILLFEFLVASIIAFIMKFLIKLSNYTNFDILQYLLAGMIILIYFLNQYFQYDIVLSENNFDGFSFFEFIKLRMSQGLTIKNLNTGWFGLVISWLIQLGLTGLFLYLGIVRVLTQYVIERVPGEVIDFAFYHLMKDKTEEEIRTELAKKGWSDSINQDEVFEAIVGLQDATEINRIK